jgi:tetratricopeptide (TPR) repeat protein
MAGATRGAELVGRDEELAQIEGFLERVEEGPAALVVEGDPGIGKTTLWRAVLDGVSAQDFLILRAEPTKVERRLSFAALADLLAPITDELGGLPVPQRKALRTALLIDEPTGPGLGERATATALLSLLGLLAAAQAVLLAVDDVQWLDAASASAIAFAFRRRGDARVKLLMTKRRAEPMPFELDAERVSVAPLSPSSIDHILRERFALRLTRPMLRKLHADTGGNPLYALELGRAFAEGATPPALDEPLPAPADLATLLSRRLAKLSRPARQALRAASLLADPTLDRIEATSGAGGIDEAVAAGVAMVERGRVRFDHPLLASVIFDEMDAGERRRIHARLADVVDDPEERARHRAAATEAPDAETAALLDDAAHRAAGRGAAAAAADLAANAVRMTPATDDALRHRRLLVAGKLARAAGDRDRCEALLREAVDAAPSGHRRAEALLWLAGNAPDDRAEARVLLDEALQHADGDAALSALILANAANCSVVETPSERLDLARRSLELAEQSGDERVLGRALATVGSVSFFAGLGPQRDVLQRAMAIEDRCGAPEVDDNPLARYQLAYQLATTGRAYEARPLYEELIARARDLDRQTVCIYLEGLSRVELRAGNWERARELVEEACQTAIESGRDGYAAQYMYVLSMVEAYRGDEKRARRLVGEMAEGGAQRYYDPRPIHSSPPS